MAKVGRESADTNIADNAMRTIDKLSDQMAKHYARIATNKITRPNAKKEIVEANL